MNVLEEIKKLLDKNKVSYKLSTHEPVYTSEQAAKVRGESIESGAKSIILRSEGKFLQVVIAGDKRIDFKKVKQVIESDRLSMATPEEVEQVIHCKVGAVPPFGNIVGIPVYLDKSLLNNPIINFNAGRHDTSIAMSITDYQQVVKPTVVDVAQ